MKLTCDVCDPMVDWWTGGEPLESLLRYCVMDRLGQTVDSVSGGRSGGRRKSDQIADALKSGQIRSN